MKLCHGPLNAPLVSTVKPEKSTEQLLCIRLMRSCAPQEKQYAIFGAVVRKKMCML